MRLCFLITRSEGAGVGDLAREMKHDRNYSKTVYELLGGNDVRRDCIHHTMMPVNVRKGTLAERQLVPNIPFYEVLARRFATDESALLRHRGAPHLLCQNFHDHDVVRKWGADAVIPARLFADYAKLDNQADAGPLKGASAWELCC